MSSLEGARVALLACGSYNPPTVMHLRMFEAARSFLESRYDCNVVEGIISPVADSFAKPGLLPACNRMQMAELAVKSSTWIHADNWECSQKQWTRTICVLKHFKDVLDKKFDIGARVKLMLLCGGDVVDTFSVITPKGTKLWDPADLLEIVRDFGLVVLSRHNSKPMETLQTLPFLDGFRSNVYVFDDDVMPNEVSSTRVRNAIRCGKSVKYCIEDGVLEYILEHHLYATTTSPKPPTNQAAISCDNADERHKSFDDESASRNI